MVRGDHSPPMFFRGINMEVSLPTGSLCSERNAIGTALSQNPRLLRKHIRMVAVLSLAPPKPKREAANSSSSGASGGAPGYASVASSAAPTPAMQTAMSMFHPASTGENPRRTMPGICPPVLSLPPKATLEDDFKHRQPQHSGLPRSQNASLAPHGQWAVFEGVSGAGSTAEFTPVSGTPNLRGSSVADGNPPDVPPGMPVTPQMSTTSLHGTPIPTLSPDEGKLAVTSIQTIPPCLAPVDV